MEIPDLAEEEIEELKREMESRYRGFPSECNAIIYHGPGHQSKAYCYLAGEHEIHEARYGRHDQLARWKGDVAYSGFFDEPPRDDLWE